MTTSTPSGASKESKNASVSAGPLYIFQLPAISLRISCLRDCGHAREHLALEQLERRAAARRDPRDLVRQPELLDCAHGIASSDDACTRLQRPRPPRRRGCPPANGSHSNTPMGPFQKIVFAATMIRAKRSRVSGPMSSPSQPSGTSSKSPPRASRHRRQRALATTTSVGSSTAKGQRVLPHAFARPSCLRSSTVSDLPPRFSSTASLSSTFAPPATITNGRSTSPRACPGDGALPAAAGPRMREGGARPLRWRHARGAQTRTRRSRRDHIPWASSRANAGSFFVSPGLKRVFSSTRRRPIRKQCRTGIPRPERWESRRRSSSVEGRPRCEQTRTSAALVLEQPAQRR